MFDPAKYGPRIAELLIPERLAELGPGLPNEPVRARLAALRPETLLEASGRESSKREIGSALLAALWLYHDFLEESHQLSQEIETPTGSYWHAIMHRREPDAWNSKYWFHRVGRHPIYSSLLESARGLAKEAGVGSSDALAFLLTQPDWDPFRWLDACDQARLGANPQDMLCRRIALCEWRLLFDYCFDEAHALA